jgi:hypothetical protein
MRPSLATLDSILSPVTSTTFLSQYYEKSFLAVKGARARFSSLFDVASIDAWLMNTRSGLRDSIVITSPEGAEVRTDAYRPQELRLDLAYSLLAKGHSIVLNHLEDWPSLNTLVKGLGATFHADVGVNAYLTPQQARTFPIHTDEHDVFVLQVEGSKVWRLHDFSILQVGFSQKRHLTFPNEWYGRTSTPQVAEILLEAGDCLYVPRGMPHYAFTQGEQSFHLTLSITPLYWLDLLKVAAEYAAMLSPPLRKALPPGFVESSHSDLELQEHFRLALAELVKHADFDGILAAARRNRVSLQGMPADGHFSHLAGLDRLSTATEVQRRPSVICFVGEGFDRSRKPRACIWFGDQHVSAPIGTLKALQYIMSNEKFIIGDIPFHDDESKVTLVRRLITEGLLRPC